MNEIIKVRSKSENQVSIEALPNCIQSPIAVVLYQMGEMLPETHQSECQG